MTTSPYSTFASNPLKGVFGPVIWPQTYLNLFYLLLGFPLGLLYFVFYSVGVSLGGGLLIIAIGAVVLFLVLLATWALILFERELTIRILHEPVPPAGYAPIGGDGMEWLKSLVMNSVTWKGLAFLILKFPLGLACWIAVVVIVSVVLSFIASPVIFAFGGNIQFGSWYVVRYWETALLSLMGIVAILPAVHAINGMGYLWAKFARVMLGKRIKIEPTAESAAEETDLVPAY
jgi:hypothetical protein